MYTNTEEGDGIMWGRKVKKPLKESVNTGTDTGRGQVTSSRTIPGQTNA